ncbi:hypothetical protein [Neptunomonas sp.]|uniref:hypothetical protein n=1 Tax=Neptunomonas sp. TaxID=1971898 RepID=UPI0025E9E37F|nr:hypothetical protein [Neptunomonas sp.]
MKTFTKTALLSALFLSTSAFASVFPLEAPKDIDAFTVAGISSYSASSDAAFVAPLDAPKDIIAAGSYISSTHATSIAGVDLFPLQAPKDIIQDYAVPSQSIAKSEYIVASSNTKFMNPLEAPKDRIDQEYSDTHQQSVAYSGYDFVSPLDAPKDVRDSSLDTSYDSNKSSVGYAFVNPLEAPKDRVSSGYCDLNGHELASEDSNSARWSAVRKQC